LVIIGNSFKVLESPITDYNRWRFAPVVSYTYQSIVSYTHSWRRRRTHFGLIRTLKRKWCRRKLDCVNVHARNMFQSSWRYLQ